MKNVGILGSGIVGQTLGSGLIKYGYDVMIGTRDVSKLGDWQSKSGGTVGSFSEAAQFGDIVILAVKGSAAKEVLNLAGTAHLTGKVVIDTTNPIAPVPPENGVLKLFTTLEDSLMEQLQSAVPQARFVKAFNQVGNALMVDPDLGGEKPTMFICGNDAEAKREVSGILTTFGHEVCDMGGAEGARAIEPLCILWCIPGMLRGEWAHAFRLLKKY